MALQLKKKTEYSEDEKGEYSAPAAGLDGMVASCVTELMNAATSFHKLHLKVTGPGSYAAHKALKGYEKFHDFADTIAEEYQGAAEKLLTYKEVSPRSLNSVKEGIAYLREMKDMIDGLQEKIPYSEIINQLDNIKSTINSIKYKLLFLS
jgi:DNA-binding ferritin-like protein